MPCDAMTFDVTKVGRQGAPPCRAESLARHVSLVFTCYNNSSLFRAALCKKSEKFAIRCQISAQKPRQNMRLQY